jgi:hypothetical protein
LGRDENFTLVFEYTFPNSGCGIHTL